MHSTCVDLSGRYAFWGDWEQLVIEGADPKSAAAFRARNARARLDRYGFSFGAGQIVEPETALLRQEGTGISVDILGKGVETRGLDDPVKLPVRIELRCERDGWRVDWRASAGGENVRTVTEVLIHLRLSADGDLLAVGEELLTKGWLFKRQITHHWRARYVRLGD
jgi:hypothetical protein